MYSLCHRYWTCTASEARYVFSGYYIPTEGVVNWKNKIYIFFLPFSGCFALLCFGVLIGLTNILNRSGTYIYIHTYILSGIHNHANFKRNNRINWSIKQSTYMSMLYVFLLFSQIYKGRPAFVRSCAIHILVRYIHCSRD